MVLSNYCLAGRKIKWIAIVFFLNILGENIFGNNSLDSISGGFNLNIFHFLFILTNVINTLTLIFIFFKDLRFPKFFLFYLALTLYAMLSSLWGMELFKSVGLSLILFFNLIWAAVIGFELQRASEGRRFQTFVDLWVIFFIINFMVENILKGVFANLDEFSMMGMVLSYFLWKRKNWIFALIIFLMSLTGQSFSSILGFGLFFILMLIKKKSSLKKLVYIVFLGVMLFFLLAFIWFGFLSEKETLIYGKDINLIMTGSGRFNAWLAVYEAILTSSWPSLLFGHGYANDRYVLEQAGLSWTIDVHNNILHILYGLGLCGFFLFLVAMIAGVKVKISPEFHEYRLAILVVFIFFGLSSSYFFARPSYIAIFWLTFLTAGFQKIQHEKKIYS
jgi:hypothetical protein